MLRTNRSVIWSDRVYPSRICPLGWVQIPTEKVKAKFKQVTGEPSFTVVPGRRFLCGKEQDEIGAGIREFIHDGESYYVQEKYLLSFHADSYAITFSKKDYWKKNGTWDRKGAHVLLVVRGKVAAIIAEIRPDMAKDKKIRKLTEVK